MRGKRGYLKRLTLCVALVLSLFSSFSCKNGLIRTEFNLTGPFDTVSSVILVTEHQGEAKHYQKLIEEELWRYHKLYDIYHDYPGLVNMKTVNDRAGETVDVAPEILDLLAFGVDVYEWSGGRVNIAMGSVLKRWHEAREISSHDPDQAFLPHGQDLEKAASHIDINKLKIDHDRGTVTLADPFMSLDVGAIAKGYAVEKIAERLEQEGLFSGVLDIGGNVRAIGKNEMTGKAWRIGIRNPDPESSSLLNKVDIEGRSVVTSGGYERLFLFQGETYSHIVDPDTLYPAHFHDAVTIIATDSAIGDFLSTALMLMDMEEGRTLLASFSGCEALWLTDKTIHTSEGFLSYQVEAKP